MSQTSIKKNLMAFGMMMIFATIFFVSMPSSEAHILVVGDARGDTPYMHNEAVAITSQLQSKGYKVVSLIGSSATTKNIMKGMYNADAIIYVGHGAYINGHYNMNGGTATGPYALYGSNDYIWGVGNQMREGWYGKTFTPPYKKGIPVILLHTCFSVGDVQGSRVANPTQTIYEFSRMFPNANYYATSWSGGEIVTDFLNGATKFADANNKNYEVIKQSTTYNGVRVWHNTNGHTAFVGNWAGTFPTAAQTTVYNDAAAEKWYQSTKGGAAAAVSTVKYKYVKKYMYTKKVVSKKKVYYYKNHHRYVKYKKVISYVKVYKTIKVRV